MITLAHASASSTATPTRFFERWVDHASWTQWSPDAEWVTVEGPVQLGARGKLKPVGGPVVPFTITALEADREYTDSSKLFGATLVFQHLVEATATGSRLEVTVTVSGPLAKLWVAILGKGFAESAPADLDRLIALAENASVSSHSA